MTNSGGNTVSVIDTATNNTVVATVTVGSGPFAVSIVPPPPGVPFLAFNAKLEIDLDRKPNKDRFELESSFTLSSTAPAINPVTEPVTLKNGTFTTTIPANSFKKHREGDEHEHGEDEDGSFNFHGVIDGVRLEALIKRTGLAILVRGRGAGRQLGRNQEPGAGEPDHRQQQRHDLGHGQDFPLKPVLQSDPMQLVRIARKCPRAGIAAVEPARPFNDID